MKTIVPFFLFLFSSGGKWGAIVIAPRKKHLKE